MRRGLRRTALALAVAPAFAGCVERGDFGRVKMHSAWNDVVAATGAVAAARRGEPVSAAGLTDAEAELRDRAWRFLVPANDRPWFDRTLAELVATRIAPASASAPDPLGYGDALAEAAVRSPVSRYRRLANDAAADAVLVEPFAQTAARVARADGLRMAAIDGSGSLTPADVANAEARVFENRCLVAWVSAATRFRILSYRAALERLVATTPDDEVVAAERAVVRLEARRTVLDDLADAAPGPPCLGEARPPPIHPAFMRPLVAKG